MPVYEYMCGDCGPFTDMRPMSEFEAPQICPDCGTRAPRVILTAPNFACMPAESRKAHATNERSSNAPMTLGQYKEKRHRAGCSCCNSSKPARLMTKSKSGAKGFPTARPWMISH